MMLAGFRSASGSPGLAISLRKAQLLYRLPVSLRRSKVVGGDPLRVRLVFVSFWSVSR